MDLSKIKSHLVKDLAPELPELEDPLNSFSIFQFNSRKNLVYELIFKKKPKNYPKSVVVKLFRTDFFNMEYEMLNKLKAQHLTVPNVLLKKMPYLLLEKVKGENMCDYINNRLKKVKELSELSDQARHEIEEAIIYLAQWISTFHKKNVIRKNDISEIIVLNKGDTRLRDFIFDATHDKMHSVDFEEAYEGNHIDDVAWICCSLLDTNPGIFEMPEPRHKMELINLFLREYYNFNDNFYFSFSYFAEKLIEFLNLVIARRSLEFGPLRKQNILRKISRGI